MFREITDDDKIEPYTIELKNCPFCGAGMGKLFIEQDEIGWYFVHCHPSDRGCGATGPGGFCENDAAVKWNKRRIPSEQQRWLEGDD